MRSDAMGFVRVKTHVGVDILGLPRLMELGGEANEIRDPFPARYFRE